MYVYYKPPPAVGPNGSFELGAKEAWLERMDFLNADLTWLLTIEQFRYMWILKVSQINMFIWMCFKERPVECELLLMNIVCNFLHLWNGFCAAWRTNLQMELSLTYFTVIYMYIF
jgi:hypothetical protein